MAQLNQIYLYVDGENFYSLTEKYLKDNLMPKGDMKTLGRVAGGECYHCPEAKFFWDASVFTKSASFGNTMIAFQNIDRAYYFTAYHGIPSELHNAKKYIRQCNFDPHIVHELKDKAAQRANLLKTDGLITKAKGVDIALTVQMLEDAPNYDICILMTSDIDYLPAIQAVRRKGKVVYVIGYEDGISKESEFFHVPDKFLFVNKQNLSGEYKFNP